MKQVTKKSDYRQRVSRFLDKVVIDAGVGRLSSQSNFKEKALPQIVRDISVISGQKPQVRPIKKSIAGFKVREGQIVGLRVTLRRKKMVDFFERLIKIVLPRVRDFGGLELSSVDGGGVLNIGLQEQFVFPEIDPEQSPISFSFGVSLVPRHKDREKAIEELRELGVPLKNYPANKR